MGDSGWVDDFTVRYVGCGGSLGHDLITEAPFFNPYAGGGFGHYKMIQNT